MLYTVCAFGVSPYVAYSLPIAECTPDQITRSRTQRYSSRSAESPPKSRYGTQNLESTSRYQMRGPANAVDATTMRGSSASRRGLSYGRCSELDAPRAIPLSSSNSLPSQAVVEIFWRFAHFRATDARLAQRMFEAEGCRRRQGFSLIVLVAGPSRSSFPQSRTDGTGRTVADCDAARRNASVVTTGDRLSSLRSRLACGHDAGAAFRPLLMGMGVMAQELVATRTSRLYKACVSAGEVHNRQLLPHSFQLNSALRPAPNGANDHFPSER